jgi:glutathione S-transferase
VNRPILWHLPISHYSEKVRWALAHKGVEHDRRAPIPGYHMAVALALTRGRHYTLPVIELDGGRIGDSTAIIAALERRHPEPRPCIRPTTPSAGAHSSSRIGSTSSSVRTSGASRSTRSATTASSSATSPAARSRLRSGAIAA